MAPKLQPGVFYGTRSKTGEIGSFTLTEYEFGPRRDSPKHSHEQTYLSLVLNGCWRETYANRVRERQPFSLTIHPAGELHAQQLVSGRARAFNVELADDWLRRLGGYSAAFRQPTEIEGGAPAWQMLRLYAEFQHLDAHSPMIIEGIILETVGELRRDVRNSADRRLPPWLLRARDILHTRFPERLSVACVAAQVRVHPVHLARTFRRQWKCTVGEYLRQRRLQYACGELIASDRPLAEIALAAGFVDQSHLSRHLRRFTGRSPAAFRRDVRAR
jgi:AraC family transcriptional regulator